MEKKKKVIELEILEDVPMSGVYEIALVDQPAIESGWMAFRSEEFVKPSSGESQDEFISRCMSVLIGDEGKPEDQAAAICYSMWEEKMSIDTGGLPPYVDEITEDKDKQKTMEFQQIDIYGYKTRFFDMCPVAIELFNHLVEMDVDMETQGMVRSAALQADRIFEIEANVLRDGIATMDDLREATTLVGDFIDLMAEINLITGMEHYVDFMFDHLGIIAYNFPEDQPIEFAAVSDLRVGDAVSWKVGGQNPRGRIREIIREGGKQVPGTGFVLRGTKDDPGYIIEIYTQDTNNNWKPSGEYAGRKADSILKNVTLSKLEFSAVFDEDKIINMAKVLGTTESQYKQKGMNFSLTDDNPKHDLYKFADGYTVYRYEGSISGNSRRFCREMVGMQKFYTYAEITAMGQAAVNPGFGEGGASTYSIWNWKGGANCKHRWQKYYVTPEGKFQNKGKAPGTPGTKPYDTPNHGYVNKKFQKMMFADEDQQIVVGPAMIPDIKIPRKDKDTGEFYDVTFLPETIAKIAEKFMRENRNNETNINHDIDKRAGSYVMESWIVETEEDKANTVYGLGVPVGTWVVKMRVTDPKVWKMVKSGELTGFSIEGDFLSKEEYDKYMEEKGKYDRIMKILKP
jgi:hypothetical protein